MANIDDFELDFTTPAPVPSARKSKTVEPSIVPIPLSEEQLQSNRAIIRNTKSSVATTKSANDSTSAALTAMEAIRDAEDVRIAIARSKTAAFNSNPFMGTLRGLFGDEDFDMNFQASLAAKSRQNKRNAERDFAITKAQNVLSVETADAILQGQIRTTQALSNIAQNKRLGKQDVRLEKQEGRAVKQEGRSAAQEVRAVTLAGRTEVRAQAQDLRFTAGEKRQEKQLTLAQELAGRQKDIFEAGQDKRDAEKVALARFKQKEVILQVSAHGIDLTDLADPKNIELRERTAIDFPDLDIEDLALILETDREERSIEAKLRSDETLAKKGSTVTTAGLAFEKSQDQKALSAFGTEFTGLKSLEMVIEQAVDGHIRIPVGIEGKLRLIPVGVAQKYVRDNVKILETTQKQATTDTLNKNQAASEILKASELIAVVSSLDAEGLNRVPGREFEASTARTVNLANSIKDFAVTLNEPGAIITADGVKLAKELVTRASAAVDDHFKALPKGVSEEFKQISLDYANSREVVTDPVTGRRTVVPGSGVYLINSKKTTKIIPFLLTLKPDSGTVVTAAIESYQDFILEQTNPRQVTIKEGQKLTLANTLSLFATTSKDKMEAALRAATVNNELNLKIRNDINTKEMFNGYTSVFKELAKEFPQVAEVALTPAGIFNSTKFKLLNPSTNKQTFATPELIRTLIELSAEIEKTQTLEPGEQRINLITAFIDLVQTPDMQSQMLTDLRFKQHQSAAAVFHARFTGDKQPGQNFLFTMRNMQNTVNGVIELLGSSELAGPANVEAALSGLTGGDKLLPGLNADRIKQLLSRR